MKRKIKSLQKKLQRRDAHKNVHEGKSPNSKVSALLKDIHVPPEVRKNLLYGEVLNTQLQEKADALPKNSKERSFPKMYQRKNFEKIQIAPYG